RGHQKCRPVDAVEAADLFADEVQVGRPVFLEFFLVFGRIRTITDGRYVVRERIEPYVDDVLLVAGYRNAPFDGGTADGEILETAAHKADDFAARGLRAHETGIGFIELEELALESRELEEVVLLAHGFRRPAAVGAKRARRAFNVSLVEDAILAGVRTLVDVAAVAKRGEKMLHAALVARLGSANEVVIGETEAIPEAAEFLRDGVGELLRSAAGKLGAAFDLLPVLVCARKKPGVDAESALATGNGVTDDGGV